MATVGVDTDSDAVLSLAGDVDTATVPRLNSIVDDMLTSVTIRSLGIDFTGNEFMDSIGLGMLVRVRLVCRDKGVTLRLLAVPHRVRVMLQITGLTTAFVIEESPL